VARGFVPLAPRSGESVGERGWAAVPWAAGAAVPEAAACEACGAGELTHCVATVMMSRNTVVAPDLV